MEKFRTETDDLIIQTESAFFELEPIVVREKKKEESENVITEMRKLTLNEPNQRNENLPEQIESSENRREIQNELKKVNSLHELKLNSFEQSEVVLSEVQIQLSEIEKSIKVIRNKVCRCRGSNSKWVASFSYIL